MPCARSCCDLRRPHAWFSGTLFWKNFTRFWPIWALYGAIWFLVLPVGILNGESAATLASLSGFYLAYDPEVPRRFLVQSIRLGATLNPLFGILAAMAVFSYLYSARSCGLFHALPIRREGLFLTSYLSGLSFFLLPILAVAALTLAAQVYVAGTAELTALFLWAWCQGLMILFFFSLGCLCAMLTGHLLALPAFYAGLNLLVVGLYGLYEQLAARLLFGYVSDPEVQRWVEWLTPVLCYDLSLGCTGYPDYRLTGLLCVFVYGFVGLLLSALALLLYRRRALETAGDVVALAWLRPVFRWCVALCAGVYLGVFLWDVLFPSRKAAGLLLGCVLPAGALGYFVAEMLLRKSFRVLRRGALGCGCFLAVLTLFFLSLALDVGGYETRVPEGEAVSSVTLSTSSLAPYDDAGVYSDYTFSDPDGVRALHRAIVEAQTALQYASFTSQWTEIPSGDHTVSVEEESYCHLELTYDLAGGRALRRSYRIPVTAALLDDPDSPAGRLETLVNDPALLERAYFRQYEPEDVLTGAYLSAPRLEDGRSFGSGDAQALLDAVRSDLAAGRLGRRFLLEDAERMEVCYYNDLTFTFLPVGRGGRGGELEGVDSYTVTVTPQTTAAETLAVLEELDALPALVSQGESGL